MAPHHARLARPLRIAVVVAGVALCPWPQGAAAERGAPRPLDVRVDGGRLTIEIGAAAPLVGVLRAIAEQTGAELAVEGDLGVVAPQAFTGRPLAEGISRLVEPHGLVLTFEPAPRPDGVPRLSSLRVYGAGASSSLPASVAAGSVEGPAPTGADRPGPASVWEFGRGAADPGVITALAEALVRDPDALVRNAAEDDSTLRNALAGDDPRARIEALRTIGARGGDDDTVGPLVAVLVGDEDPAVRRAAVEVLADLGSEDARLALEGALDDPDATVRTAAARALGR